MRPTLTNVGTDRQTHTQAHKQTSIHVRKWRQTNKQRNRNRKADREINKQTNKETERLTEINKQTGQEANKADSQTQHQTHLSSGTQVGGLVKAGLGRGRGTEYTSETCEDRGEGVRRGGGEERVKVQGVRV